MKLLAIPFSLSLLTLASAAHAECGGHRGALVADLGLHVVNAGYQHALGCYVTAQATAGLYVPWTVSNDVLGLGGGRDGSVTVGGFGLRARAFFHPLGEAPAGLWISPFVQGGVVRASVPGRDLYGPAFAAGVSVGWTWRLGARWLLALGLGAQYHRASFNDSTDAPGFSRLGPTVDINVAYRL
jgi:Protein of unknown function (DUF3575)